MFRSLGRASARYCGPINRGEPLGSLRGRATLPVQAQRVTALTPFHGHVG
jgi:hypothetical protein